MQSYGWLLVTTASDETGDLEVELKTLQSRTSLGGLVFLPPLLDQALPTPQCLRQARKEGGLT